MLLYGLRAIFPLPAGNRPHVFGFTHPRGNEDQLFRIDNDAAGADAKVIVYPSQTMFATHLRPLTTNVRDLGSATNRWRKLFAVDTHLAGNLEIEGTITVQGTGGGGIASNPHGNDAHEVPFAEADHAHSAADIESGVLARGRQHELTAYQDEKIDLNTHGGRLVLPVGTDMWAE